MNTSNQQQNDLIAQVTLDHIRTLEQDLKAGMQNGLYRDCSLTTLEELQELRTGLSLFVAKLEYSFKRSGFSNAKAKS